MPPGAVPDSKRQGRFQRRFELDVVLVPDAPGMGLDRTATHDRSEVDQVVPQP